MDQIERSKFDKEWTKKNPFIQPVSGDQHSFFCTVCSKKVRCSHQAFGDVVRHCKSEMHKKFKNQLNEQQRLKEPDETMKKKA